MNDVKQSHNDAPVLGPIAGFALGVLVGGGLALLLAPASGETTRRRVGDTARRLNRDARHAFDEAREKVSEVGSEVKSAIDAGREAFGQGGEHEPLPSSRAPTHTPPPTRTP